MLDLHLFFIEHLFPKHREFAQKHFEFSMVLHLESDSTVCHNEFVKTGQPHRKFSSSVVNRNFKGVLKHLRLTVSQSPVSSNQNVR